MTTPLVNCQRPVVSLGVSKQALWKCWLLVAKRRIYSFKRIVKENTVTLVAQLIWFKPLSQNYVTPEGAVSFTSKFGAEFTNLKTQIKIVFWFCSDFTDSSIPPNGGREHTTTFATTDLPATRPQTPFTCKGKVDGRYSDPFNCEMYYECSHGIIYHRSCPDTLQFNQGAGQCLEENDGKCQS